MTKPICLALTLFVLTVPSSASAALKFCDGDTTDGDDLRARNVTCQTAKRVYNRSLKVAAVQNDTPTTFRYQGRSWTCRAYNPHKRNGNPAWYEWKCRASGKRLVWFRWLGGE